MGGFQSVINNFPAPAVVGDFSDAGPYHSVPAGPGGLVSGPGGVIVGNFAWVDTDGVTVHSFGVDGEVPAGIVQNSQQALITQFLGIATLLIPEGFPVTLIDEGSLWVKLFGDAASVGDDIYARFSDGAAFAGGVPSGASVTASIGSTSTGSLGSTFTATATGTSLAVTALTGYLAVGDVISGTGVPAGTTIVAQVSGTTGAAGTYTTSVVTTAAAATVTSFGSTIKTTATTGLISVGDTVSATSFPAGATIVAQVSGTTGGAGVYTISLPGTAYVASATGVTTFGNVLDVTAIGSGVLHVGDELAGTGVPTDASIASQVSGTPGGIGVYTITEDASAYAASTTVTVTDGILTSFVAKSSATVGEIVKVSTWGN
jgi:hypothetical protein